MYYGRFVNCRRLRAFGRSVFAGKQASQVFITQVGESTTTLTCERPGAGARIRGCGSKSCKQTAHKKEVQPEALGHKCMSGRKEMVVSCKPGAIFDGFGWRAWINESSHWMRFASGNTQVIGFSFGGFWLYHKMLFTYSDPCGKLHHILHTFNTFLMDRR